MRKLIAAAAALILIPAASAQATFHLEKVNEVMLASSSGDTAAQFVELLDTGGTEEQFTPVFAPYQLKVYDAAGKLLGQQTLDPNGLRAAAQTGSEYLISTAAADNAFGVTGNERLTVSLPADAGQICFAGSPGEVSCMSYGTISKPVQTNSQGTGTGTVHGPVPGAGLSDQRQPDNTVKAATPTPKAKNRSDVGGQPGSPQQAPFSGVLLVTRTARVNRQKRFSIAVRCPASAQGQCRGTAVLSVGGQEWCTRHFSASSGQTKTLPMDLNDADYRRVRRQHDVNAAVRIAARDASGQQKVTRGHVTLRG
jgi:hypothetical protein